MNHIWIFYLQVDTEIWSYWNSRNSRCLTVSEYQTKSPTSDHIYSARGMQGTLGYVLWLAGRGHVLTSILLCTLPVLASLLVFITECQPTHTDFLTFELNVLSTNADETTKWRGLFFNSIFQGLFIYFNVISKTVGSFKPLSFYTKKIMELNILLLGDGIK